MCLHYEVQICFDISVTQRVNQVTQWFETSVACSERCGSFELFLSFLAGCSECGPPPKTLWGCQVWCFCALFLQTKICAHLGCIQSKSDDLVKTQDPSVWLQQSKLQWLPAAAKKLRPAHLQEKLGLHNFEKISDCDYLHWYCDCDMISAPRGNDHFYISILFDKHVKMIITWFGLNAALLYLAMCAIARLHLTGDRWTNVKLKHITDPKTIHCIFLHLCSWKGKTNKTQAVNRTF